VYIVTASNASTSTTTALTITVSDAATPLSNLSYPSPQTYLLGAAITPLAPTITGIATSYSVSPALPAGLSLSSATGVISGTPSAITGGQNVYTVTASNSSSSVQTQITIGVNDLGAPQVAYASTYYAFTAGLAGTIPAPVNSGGGSVTYSIAPALPASLTLGTDGRIQGTPPAAAAAASYTVTATNLLGSVTIPLTIAVGPPPLLDLGLTSNVQRLRMTGSRLLSQDISGHWRLQDFASGNVLASGSGPCVQCVDMAGNAMVDVAPQGLEIRAASDGHLISVVPGSPAWWQLAADGSYLVTADATGLTVYDTASAGAQKLTSRSGDYSKAIAYPAPGQVQVAAGPAGANVIETVAVATGTSTVGPAFLGNFSAWFQDGGHFLTAQGTAVRTYSSAGVQQDITQLNLPGSLGGYGNWFWFDSSVYQVGASSSPVLTMPSGIPVPSGSTIGVVTPEGTGQVTVVDLSGSRPLMITGPSVPISYLSAFAAASASSWVTGNQAGVIFDGASPPGQPRYLSLGEAMSIAGGTSFASVATASGSIFTFDPATNAQVGKISFLATQLFASGDGTVLAATADPNANPYDVNVYSLPSGSLIHSFSYSSPFPSATLALPSDISLSGSGTVIAQSFMNPTYSGCSSEVIATTGGTPVWCSPTVQTQLRLSPDGTKQSSLSGGSLALAITNIWANGTLTGAVSGAAVGWVDNSRLLANTYVANHNLDNVYTGAGLYDPTGKLLVSTPVPELQSIQPLTGDTVYSSDRNIILSLTQGQTFWASANTATRLNTTTSLNTTFGAGAAAGSEVFFVSGTQLVAQPAVTTAPAAQGLRLSRRRP
jgi:hypothetical protein